MIPLASTPAVTNPVTIFLVVLGIILIVPLVLQRLKIPYVIGLILAGVAVGPYGFDVVDRDMSFEVFGQVGVLYLMFLAGLEIDMYHLRKMLAKGLTFGLSTFFIPLLLGIAAGWLWLQLDLLAAMLLASMFAAHTLLSYPIASRFGLTRTTPVVIAVSGTIVTVLGALIVLAGVTSIYREGMLDTGGIALLLGVIALYCCATAYIYPRITRFFFRRYSDNVAQFIFVLAMVFLAAAVARWIGIEGVFGAFFAGLVLNRYIPGRSPLMTRIEFVGNAIFIPYFLIGVGMLINVQVVTNGWNTLYVAAVMSVVAMGSKWLAAWVTQLIFKLKAIDRSMMYQLSNAHTAVALAVVTIGYNMQIFSEEILNGTIVMILVTCTVSSIGTERASRRLKIKLLEQEGPSEADSRANSAEPPRTLISVSNPIIAPQLVDLALMMRMDDSPESRLYALHVRSDNSPTSLSISRNSLDVAERNAASVDASLIPIERFDNNVVTGLLHTIAERDITEVVIGLHRRSHAADSFLGNKIEQLLAATNKMVVISRLFIPVNTVSRIVVYVPPQAELETGFRRWVEALGALTRQLGCRLIVWCTPESQRLLNAVLRHGRFTLRTEFRHLTDTEDYVLLPGELLDDDLLVMVHARRASVSFESHMDEIPRFLMRNMAHQNLMLIYPEQFGREPDIDSMSLAMSADFVAAPTSLWLKLRAGYRRADSLRRRLSSRKSSPTDSPES